MAEMKKLMTRIQSRKATYAEWIAANPVLLDGEIAVVVVPAETGAVVQEPALLFKVGDGVSDFKTLGFAAGVAADVYGWAKAPTKPTYKAEEITGLDTYIAGEIQDTDTQYKLEKDPTDGHILKLSAKTLDGEWVVQDTITTVDTVYNDTGVKADIAALEALVGSKSVAEQISAAVEEALNAAKKHADDLNTAMDTRMQAVEGKAHEHANKAELDKIVEGDVAKWNGAQAAAEATAAAALSAAKTELEGKITAEAEAARAAEKANADAITAIKDGTELDSFADVEAKIATLDAGESGLGNRIKAIEDDYLKGADKTELEGKIKDNADAIALLNDGATVEGSVDYKIAQAVAAIMENPDETMNSINELVTWINDHAQDALELSNKVSANEQDIAALEGLVGETGVAAQIEAAIAAALKVDGVDKYALASDLTAAIGRIAAMEAKVATWDAAEQNAKDYADDLNTAMNTRVEALEAIDHDHGNKTILDGITAEKVAAWDAAEQNAKSYTDGLAENYDAAGAAEAVRGELNAYKTSNDAEVAKKANDADLAAIAKTGNVNDLVQTEGEYIILCCGGAE